MGLTLSSTLVPPQVHSLLCPVYTYSSSAMDGRAAPAAPSMAHGDQVRALERGGETRARGLNSSEGVSSSGLTRDRQTDRQRETDSQTERERETERARARERERERNRQTDRQTETERDREREVVNRAKWGP